MYQIRDSATTHTISERRLLLEDMVNINAVTKVGDQSPSQVSCYMEVDCKLIPLGTDHHSLVRIGVNTHSRLTASLGADFEVTAVMHYGGVIHEGHFTSMWNGTVNSKFTDMQHLNQDPICLVDTFRDTSMNIRPVWMANCERLTDHSVIFSIDGLTLADVCTNPEDMFALVNQLHDCFRIQMPEEDELWINVTIHRDYMFFPHDRCYSKIYSPPEDLSVGVRLSGNRVQSQDNMRLPAVVLRIKITATTTIGALMDKVDDRVRNHRDQVIRGMLGDRQQVGLMYPSETKTINVDNSLEPERAVSSLTYAAAYVVSTNDRGLSVIGWSQFTDQSRPYYGVPFNRVLNNLRSPVLQFISVPATPGEKQTYSGRLEDRRLHLLRTANKKIKTTKAAMHRK